MTIKKFNSSGQLTPEAIESEKQLQQLFSAYRGVDDDYAHAGTDALERWRDWKFGIRIHWSIYSMIGNGPESWPLSIAFGNNGTPTIRAQYEELYKFWNPCFFDSEAWCDLFVKSGLKFFVFTTKHHDGFSMYGTKTKVKKRRVHIGPDTGKIIDCDLHYSIMDTPFKRDIVKELIDSARKQNIGIGLYFSHIDWFDSDFRIDQWGYQLDNNYTKQSDPEGFKRMILRHRQQICEILSNYGKIDDLSLDMHFDDLGRKHGIHDEIIETIKMARRLQPDIMIRERGIGPYGDYTTPERTIPQSPADIRDMPWQVIYPGGKHFSFQWGDDYKPAEWIIKNLIDITAKGGCFQVGYGPRPDGRWDAEIVHRLTEVGDWLRVNGEGIYATRPYKIFEEGPNIRYSRSKDNKFVYAFVMNWPDEPISGGNIALKAVRAKSNSQIKMLGLDHNFDYTQNKDVLNITVPVWFGNLNRPCKFAHCFKIEI